MKNILLIILLFISTNTFAAINFDKVDDRLSCGTSDAIFQENGALTVSAWIYPFSTNAGSTPRIITRQSGGSGISFGLVATNTIQFTVSGSGTTLNRSANNNFITLNTWNHVVVTWDGSTTASNAHIYVNNIEVTYSTSISLVTPVDTNGFTTAIGNRNSTWDRAFDGYITEISYWNSVLTAGNISTLYGNGKPIRGIPLTISGLLLYIPMNTGGIQTSSDGFTFTDLSSGGNNCTGNDGTNNIGLFWTDDTALFSGNNIIRNSNINDIK